jgi:hypothetical protein
MSAIKDETAWDLARETAERSFEPIAHGAIYCSPRCGFRCLRAAYDRAIKEGAALSARMGSGWQSHVWENCGWHYSVVKGIATISPEIHGGALSGTWTIGGYTANLQSGDVQVTERAPAPEDALGYALQRLRGIERRIAADCAALYAEGGTR